MHFPVNKYMIMEMDSGISEINEGQGAYEFNWKYVRADFVCLF